MDSILHTKKYKEDEVLANEKGMEILKKVGLADQAELLAGNLPYGWQRRLEIARALALSPRILLLDEPAAGMNPSETAELMQFIQELNRGGITCVVIEHDMKFIMNLCDRIVVINSGQKLAEGSPEEVTRNPKVIEAYLGAGLTIEKFMNNYRIVGGGYDCTNMSSSVENFTNELMLQKRIEFWGEGIVMFDMKRLDMSTRRGYVGTNSPASYRLNTEGRAPYWNFVISRGETQNNPVIATQNNPDPSQTVKPWNG